MSLKNNNYMIYINVGELNNYKVEKVLNVGTGTGFSGTGLWTGICVGCANIFGTSSKNYRRKLSRAKAQAMSELEIKAKQFGANAILNLSFAISGLSVLASGTFVIVKE